MNPEKNSIKRNILTIIFIFIPIFIIILIIWGRVTLVPSNEEIINYVKNINCYSSQVNYTFKNSRSEYTEVTKQYYSNNGARIEFQDGYERVKVYKGGEIKVHDTNSEEFTLDKDIDIFYPIAFLENVFSNKIVGEIKEVKAEWGESDYLEVNIEYNSKNNHLNKAQLYIDKKSKTPVLLKVLDNNDKERIIITYSDFKKEKNLSEDLF